MEDTIEKIKEYVLIIDPTLEGENDLLDYVIADVVDRALIYTNRQQLVEQYEEDLTDYDADDDFWSGYHYPIPKEIERALASVVVQSYKTIGAKKDATGNTIKSISDNGQSITYGDQVASYLASSGDSEIFSGTSVLLDKFRIPNVVENY